MGQIVNNSKLHYKTFKFSLCGLESSDYCFNLFIKQTGFGKVETIPSGGWNLS
jgi:hypothetical protein